MKEKSPRHTSKAAREAAGKGTAQNSSPRSNLLRGREPEEKQAAMERSANGPASRRRWPTPWNV